MQNRYVGDAGDYAKHGLLRRLSGLTDPETPAPDLRLGLVWYMHVDELHGADKTKIADFGGFTAFLDPGHKDAELHRRCDPDLWEKLRQFVDEGRRCVHCIHGSGILPADTLYYDALLHYPIHLPRPDRKRNRNLWLAAALQATAAADLVCVDPDTGIAKPEQMLRLRGPKFTYISDLQEFWNREQSLVVYQHTDRVLGSAQDVAAKLRDGLPGAEPIPMRYRHGASRVFFVLPQPAHRERIEARIARMLDGPWAKNGHFERVGEQR